MPVADLTSPPPSTDRVVTDDPFQRLHKMSTTAGVGAGDYVAISGTAVAAVLLGLASGTVLFDNPFLLLIPLAGVIVAVLAWVRVGLSNGTLAGRGLAVLGLALSAGLGGYQAVKAAGAAISGASANGKVIALIHEFGHDVAVEDYARAYALCDDEFKGQVPLSQFEGMWRAAHGSADFGSLSGIDWNGQLSHQTDLRSGLPEAGGMVLVQYSKGSEPHRTDMFFRLTPQGWRVHAIPKLFPIAAPSPAPGTPAVRSPQTANQHPVGPQMYGPAKP